MNLRDQQQQALAMLGGFAVADEPLAPHTTYKLGGPAAVFATPRSGDELRQVADATRATGLPVLVVGRGSNLLVADAGFPGIAVSLVAGALEAVFVNPAAANSVRVVRINPRTGASLGAITRAATASESWAIPFAPQYGIAEAAWLVSMDYAGAPLMSWRIVDRGDGTAGSHTQLKLDSGEIIDDFR